MATPLVTQNYCYWRLSNGHRQFPRSRQGQGRGRGQGWGQNCGLRVSLAFSVWQQFRCVSAYFDNGCGWRWSSDSIQGLRDVKVWRQSECNLSCDWRWRWGCYCCCCDCCTKDPRLRLFSANTIHFIATRHKDRLPNLSRLALLGDMGWMGGENNPEICSGWSK